MMNWWRINLRHDQRRVDVGSLRVTSEEVTIFAPQWVQKGLELLKTPMNCFIYDTPPSSLSDTQKSFDPTTTTPAHFASFTVHDKLNLRDLQKITRNQHRNTSGIISWPTWYSQDIPKDMIVGMKDLARQCVIVGRDLTTGYGGYGAPFVTDASRTYLCDLAGLQFQQKCNSGRLVLVEEEPFKGCFDDFIFSHVVGEERKTFDQVQGLIQANEDYHGKRYIQSTAFGQTCYFDTFAYKKFVQTDVVTSGRALSKLAKSNKDRLNFKFLKYGTGFFAGNFLQITNDNILEGVIDGLETLFENYEDEVQGVICAVEFPFYREDKRSEKRLKQFKKKWGVNSSFSRDDALKSTVPGLVTATTNCADSHAVFGNEMGYGSVDAAIATNLQSKGDIFCPVLNCSMKEEFLP